VHASYYLLGAKRDANYSFNPVLAGGGIPDPVGQA
jgi:hypothetical protein